MGNDGREIAQPRLPAEQRAGAIRRRDDAGGISGPARGDLHAEIDARGALDRLDHLEDGKSAAVTAIER